MCVCVYIYISIHIYIYTYIVAHVGDHRRCARVHALVQRVKHRVVRARVQRQLHQRLVAAGLVVARHPQTDAAQRRAERLRVVALLGHPGERARAPLDEARLGHLVVVALLHGAVQEDGRARAREHEAPQVPVLRVCVRVTGGLPPRASQLPPAATYQ